MNPLCPVGMCCSFIPAHFSYMECLKDIKVADKNVNGKHEHKSWSPFTRTHQEQLFYGAIKIIMIIKDTHISNNTMIKDIFNPVKNVSYFSPTGHRGFK